MTNICETPEFLYPFYPLELEKFSQTIKEKKGKLVFYPYRDLRLSVINKSLYLYRAIREKKSIKFQVLDIALFDPLKQSLMDHFKNYRRYL